MRVAAAMTMCWALLACAGRGACQAGAVAATVNGETITVEDWMAALQNLHAQDFVVSASPLRFSAAPAGEVALQRLVNGRLLLQLAAKTHLLPTDAEVDADARALKAQAAVAQALARGLFTEARLREQVRVQRAAFNLATINQSLAPGAAKAYYDAHPERWGRPEQWTLAAIRVADGARAQKAAAEIRAGTAFAEVARRYSEDQATRSRGGDIGTLATSDPRLPAPVREAVRRLKAGEVSPPIAVTYTEAGATRSAFVIVRLAAREAGNVPPFEQVKEQAERLALLEKAGGEAAAQRKVDDYRKQSKIEVVLPAYKDLFRPGGTTAPGG